MSYDYSTNGLIESVKIDCAVPINQSTWTPTAILAVASKLQLVKIVPLVRTLHAKHFETFADQAATRSTLSYPIDAGAANRSLVNVAALDVNDRPVKLAPIDLHQEIDLGAWWRAHIRTHPETGCGYYPQGDRLHFFPEAFDGTLRLYFHRLPNRLCRSQTVTIQGNSYAAEAVQVVSVNTDTGAITCTASSVPSTITTSTPVCVVQGTPGFEHRILTATPTAVTSTIVTLGSNIAEVAAAGIVAGDWLQLAGDTAVPQLPLDVHPILSMATAAHILRVMGSPQLQAAVAELGEMSRAYLSSNPLRVEDDPKDIHSNQRLADAVMG